MVTIGQIEAGTTYWKQKRKYNFTYYFRNK